jgi:DHA1 family bicyclomycin/chloramphenicol resistance-like MFS transporter
MHNQTTPRFLDRTTPPTFTTLILLASVNALAMNVFLPSFPSMAVHFGTTTSVMGLSISIFLAVSAFVQLFAGPLSDLTGRRPVIIGSLAIFCIATLGIIFSENLTFYFTMRALQAVSASAMILSRAIVRDTTSTEKSASRIAYLVMGMAIIPMISPGIGGYIEEHIGWRANFILLLSFSALLLALVVLDLGETSPNTGRGFADQFKDYPILLTSPRFWGYCMSSALGAGAFFAYLGGAPFVGEKIFDLSAEELGLYLGTPSIGYFAGNYLSGRYSGRIKIDHMVLAGLIIAVAALSICLVMSYTGTATPFSFFGLMVVLGLGNGLSMPNATAGMLSVRPQLAGTASGLGGSMMIGGGAALSALAGGLLTPDTGEFPLLWVMWGSVALGTLCGLFVLKRNKRLGML